MERKYAQGTTVPVEKSEAEIKGLLRKHGATNAVTTEVESQGLVVVQFDLKGKRHRFSAPVPKRDAPEFTQHPRQSWKKRPEAQAFKLWEQACRAQWRAMLLSIRSKFINAANGIESLDMGLMPYVVMPDGKTMAEHAMPIIDTAYKLGFMPEWKMLPPGAEGRSTT